MIVIPMAGHSQRFFDAGYSQSKFMLPLWGEYVFNYAVRSFRHYFCDDLFVFIIRKNESVKAFVEEQAEYLGVRAYRIEELRHATDGQAETVYRGLKNYPISTDLIIFNIDTFRFSFVKPEPIPQCDGLLEVFHGSGDQWSFVMPGPSKQVIATTEKERISDLCSTGLYYFARKEYFDHAFTSVYNQGLRTSGEYYIAPLYNLLIQDGYDIRYSVIRRDQVVFCGTPEDYEALTSRTKWS